MADAQKILVVDDEPRITAVLNEYFSALGYTVLTARSGREALERVEADRPSLVLLDIRMPGMDGMEVLRQIKARAPRVEVIMITAVKDLALASESLALGARDYITKPFDLDYLERSVLTQLLSQSSASELTDPSIITQFFPRPSASVLEAPPATAPSIPEVHPAVVLAVECFRLAGGQAPARLAQRVEECALRLLEAVATGSDGQPHLKSLRLYLQVAQLLGGLTAEELARLDTLCQVVETVS